jgi:hypothetical protein
MNNHQNDTYGELTEDEHQDLRAHALSCIECGMLATVDPVFHQARYQHKPRVVYGGATYTWDGRYTRWVPAEPWRVLYGTGGQQS